MIELDVDLRKLEMEDTTWWDDDPLIGELLIALRSCAGQRVKIRVLQYHRSPGPNLGHSEEEDDGDRYELD